MSTELLHLPKDLLGVILDKLDGSSLLHAVMTCSRLATVAEATVLAPWKNNSRGLIHALDKRHFGYFARCIISSGTRLDPAARAPFNHQYVPLFAAVCGRGFLDGAKLLLRDERIDPNAECNAALECAASAGHVDIVKWLLTVSKPYGSRALWFAAVGGHADVMRILIQDRRSTVQEALQYQERVWYGGSLNGTDAAAGERLRKMDSGCVVQ